MANALDTDKAFENFWKHWVGKMMRPHSPFTMPSDIDELREFALNVFTDGFYAGREYEAELVEESECG